MQLYFIRHAQSTNNVLWDQTRQTLGRSSDPELSPAGERQAMYLARFLKEGNPDGASGGGGFGLTHVYCSLMLRAVQTGSAIARTLGLPLVGLEDAHEEGGVYLTDDKTGERVGQSGYSRGYFREHFPELIWPEGLHEDGWWNYRPFEMAEARPERAHRLLAALLDRHGGREDRVALVSHGGFYNHFLAAVYGGAPREGVWFVMNNGGITRLHFYDGLADVIYMNRTDFLPPDLLT